MSGFKMHVNVVNSNYSLKGIKNESEKDDRSFITFVSNKHS